MTDLSTATTIELETIVFDLEVLLTEALTPECRAIETEYLNAARAELVQRRRRWDVV